MMPAEPASFVIRPEKADDRDEVAAIDEMLAVTFPGESIQRRLVATMRQRPEYRAASALVAMVGDAVVGYVMVSTGWLDGPSGRLVIATLAPLGVRPAYQNMGIGGALLDAAADRAQADGSPVLVLEGPPDYYLRHGFVTGPSLGIDSQLTVEMGGRAPMVRRLNGYHQGHTGTVVYAQAFADTM